MKKFKNPFYHKSFVSIHQIKAREEIQYLFSEMRKMKTIVEKNDIYEPLKGKTIAVLFYQPSTRTFSSFVAAAKRLGAYVIDIHEMTQFSSAVKGESLEDTVRTIKQTTGADLLVLRHPENNSSEIAADLHELPVINGGSGTAEHPTQALLDLFTIHEKFGTFDNLHIMMVGDLKYGRTIKSLAQLLAVVSKKTKISFVSPKELRAPKDFVKELKTNMKVSQKTSFGNVVKHVDVVYMTRVQKEWFEKEGKLEEYEKLKLKFVITKSIASKMKRDSIIMHPLPRVGEIQKEVDNDQRAYYFKQMRSGLYARMALLKNILVEH